MPSFFLSLLGFVGDSLLSPQQLAVLWPTFPQLLHSSLGLATSSCLVRSFRQSAALCPVFPQVLHEPLNLGASPK